MHYRRAGDGPVVVLLHQSPRSSAELLPLLARWSNEFTCIAPDMPGYGESDPFAVSARDSITLEDLADATVEFLDALGLKRVAFYGVHTGAMLAALIALRSPSRVSAVAANGVALFDERERADWLAHHIPPLALAADGSHIESLWARARAQYEWFPWFRQDAEHRLNPAPPAPSAHELQEYVSDILRAGDNYRVAYRAALAHRFGETLSRLTVPTLVTASTSDRLVSHLNRIATPSSAVTVNPGGDAETTVSSCRAFLADHIGG